MSAADEDLAKRADLRARHGAEVDTGLITPHLQGVSAAFAMERAIKLTDPPQRDRHGVAGKRTTEVQVEAIQLRAFAVSTLLGAAELITKTNFRHLDALSEHRRCEGHDRRNRNHHRHKL